MPLEILVLPKGNEYKGIVVAKHINPDDPGLEILNASSNGSERLIVICDDNDSATEVYSHPEYDSENDLPSGLTKEDVIVRGKLITRLVLGDAPHAMDLSSPDSRRGMLMVVRHVEENTQEAQNN